MEFKVCSRCNCEKNIVDNFYKSKVSSDGFNAWCKNCMKEYKEKYRQKNKDKLRKQYKEYRIKNKSVISERMKKYYEINKKKHNENGKLYRLNNKEKTRAYYEKNKEKIISKIVASYKVNSEQFKRNSRIRRTRLKSLPATLTVKEWEKIKLDFDYKCAYCGQKKKLEQEHLIPLSKGGEYTKDNIIPSCKSCNCSKQNNDFLEWFSEYEHYDSSREKFILEYLGYKNGIQQLSIL